MISGAARNQLLYSARDRACATGHEPKTVIRTARDDRNVDVHLSSGLSAQVLQGWSPLVFSSARLRVAPMRKLTCSKLYGTRQDLKLAGTRRRSATRMMEVFHVTDFQLLVQSRFCCPSATFRKQTSYRSLLIDSARFI